MTRRRPRRLAELKGRAEHMQQPTGSAALWAAVCFAAWVACSAAPSGTRMPARLAAATREPYDPLCTSNWTLEPCIPFNNKCGAGLQLGKRTGELCRVLTAMFECGVECPETEGLVHVVESAAKANKKLRQKYQGAYIRSKPSLVLASINYRSHQPGSLYVYAGCTYRAGPWDRCSPVKLIKERQDSLVTAFSSSDNSSECPAARTITMDCSWNEAEHVRERCTYTEWSQWSPCLNATRSRSRNVTSGAGACSNKTRHARHCGATSATSA